MSSNTQGSPQGNYGPTQPVQYPYGSGGTTQYGGYSGNPYSAPPPPILPPKRTNRWLIILIVILIFVVALSVSGFVWAVTKLTATGGTSSQATTTPTSAPTTTAITPTVGATQPPVNGTPQEIIVPTGSSQQVLAGDCVDTWQFANIHAQYSVVFDKAAWKRVKITETGSVDGKATIYRNSPCNSTP